MEALSPTMEEGQVVKWLKGEGDAVAQGDILAEIETDKATMELVARGTGVLRKVFVGEGAAAPVGDVIAVIAAEDEDIAALVVAAGGGGGQVGQRVDGAGRRRDIRSGSGCGAHRCARRGSRFRDRHDTRSRRGPGCRQHTRVPPPPAASRPRPSPDAWPQDAGLDLAAVQGSGPGGRVIKRDVEAAAPGGCGGPGSRRAHMAGGRSGHRVRGHPAVADEEDGRTPPDRVARTRAPLLPYRRRGHDPRSAGAQAGQPAACGAGRQGVDQRFRDQGLGGGPDPPPRVQRLVAGRLHPPLQPGSHGDRSCRARRSDHAGGQGRARQGSRPGSAPK